MVEHLEHLEDLVGQFVSVVTANFAASDLLTEEDVFGLILALDRQVVGDWVTVTLLQPDGRFSDQFAEIDDLVVLQRWGKVKVKPRHETWRLIR